MNRIFAFLNLVSFHWSLKAVTATPLMGTLLFDASDMELYDMPTSCVDQNYCFEKGDSYPDHMIQEMFKQMVNHRGTPIYLGKTTGGNFYENFVLEENPDCPTYSTNKPIYYIVDEYNKVRVVVQSPNFQQILNAKWCQRPGLITVDTPHFLKGSNIVNKFKIGCETTFMDFEFFVLSNEGLNPSMEAVTVKDIPVCCKCTYSENNYK